MYSGIYLSSEGNEIFTLLGFLDKIKEKIVNVKVWNIIGNSSIILLLKILGFNYTQSFDRLKDCKLINLMKNGISLLLNDQESNKDIITEWIKELIDGSIFYHTDLTLEKIFERMKIFPNFIVYNRTKGEIEKINPNTHPNVNILDCILLTLPGIGLYNTFQYNENIYSNIFSINNLPLEYCEKSDEIKTLFILNNFHINVDRENNSPLFESEKELILQKIENYNYKLENTISNNTVKLNYLIHFQEIKEEEKIMLKNIGFKQGEAYLDGKSMKEYYENYLMFITNQN